MLHSQEAGAQTYTLHTLVHTSESHTRTATLAQASLHASLKGSQLALMACRLHLCPDIFPQETNSTGHLLHGKHSETLKIPHDATPLPLSGTLSTPTRTAEFETVRQAGTACSAGKTLRNVLHLLVQRQPEAWLIKYIQSSCAASTCTCCYWKLMFLECSQPACHTAKPANNMHALEVWTTLDTMHKEWDSCSRQLPGSLCCNSSTPKRQNVASVTTKAGAKCTQDLVPVCSIKNLKITPVDDNAARSDTKWPTGLLLPLLQQQEPKEVTTKGQNPPGNKDSTGNERLQHQQTTTKAADT